MPFNPPKVYRAGASAPCGNAFRDIIGIGETGLFELEAGVSDRFRPFGAVRIAAGSHQPVTIFSFSF
jgi:hypothetical protein